MPSTHAAERSEGGRAGGLGVHHRRETRPGGRRLGQRESYEDWLDLGRDLTRRGLRAPWLVVSDGAPGLIKAIEEVWPEADRGRCTVHKLRNVVAKLPRRPGLHQAIKKNNYWAALDEATDPVDAERRLRALVAELERP